MYATGGEISGDALGRPGILEHPTKGMNSNTRSRQLYLLRGPTKISAFARIHLTEKRVRKFGKAGADGSNTLGYKFFCNSVLINTMT